MIDDSDCTTRVALLFGRLACLTELVNSRLLEHTIGGTLFRVLARNIADLGARFGVR